MSFSVEEQRYLADIEARLLEVEYETGVKQRPDPNELPPAPPPTAEERLAELEAKLAALTSPPPAPAKSNKAEAAV